jgi:mannose-1-phosphate guanylyltransferase
VTALETHRYAVVVAGGSGTRLWPLSRERLPKQMRALMSDKPLIVETVDRLRGVIPPDHVYISTTQNHGAVIRELLPEVPACNVIVEPMARGTAAAFALVACRLSERDPDAVVFSLASDHAITDIEAFQQTVRGCFDFVEANRGHLALVGIKPTRPDTGLGYIKVRDRILGDPPVYAAEKFVEKPSHRVALGYLRSGEYYWNAANYCFAVTTLIEAYDDADPRLVQAARRYVRSGDPGDFLAAPRKVHEIEVIDSSKFPLAVVAADFPWSDIGNWQALHRVLADLTGQSMVTMNPGQHIDVNSSNCLVYADDDRIVATAGLDNIVVVSTPDVVLVLNMDQLDELPELRQRLHRQHLDQYL